MKIKYHKGAWRCPACVWCSGISRYKIGTHMRRCRNKNCKAKILVTVQNFYYKRTVCEKEITAQPVEVTPFSDR